MYSLAFPNIFSSTQTNLYQDREALMSNLKLLLGADKLSLYGDPYFGTNLKKYLYYQDSPILKDLLIDEIYSAIKLFMPELVVERKDITITSTNTKIDVNVKIKINNSASSDMYTITLLEYTE